MTKQFYSVAEIAKVLGVSRGLIYSAISKHEIPAIAVGARVLIPVHWLEEVQSAKPGISPNPDGI